MGPTKLGVVNLERYLLYGMILSMATYAIPFLRINTEKFIFPVGGVFIPLSCFLLLVRYFVSRKVTLSKFLILSLFPIYFSIPLSSFFSVSLEAERIFKLSVFMSLPVLFSGVLNDYKSLRTSLYLIITVGSVLCIYGFYGYFTGNVGEEPQKIWWWTYAKYWGIHYLPSTRNSDIYYIAIPLIIISALLFYGNLKSLFIKILLISICMMFFASILLSFSRGSWISTFLTIIVLIFMILKKHGISKRKSPENKLLLIFGIIVVLTIVSELLNYFEMYDYFIGRMISIFSHEKAGYYLQESISNEERLEILKVTTNIIFSNPLGVGTDNLRYFYNSYGLNVNHAENTYLHILAEHGILGFIGFSIFIFYPMIMLYKRIKAGCSDWIRISIFLSSIYLATSYMFNVEIFSFYNWIIHSIIWSNITIKDS